MEDTKVRDRELYAAYRKFMNEINVNHAKAVALAVKSPASRYWVSPNYLYREIRKREKMEKDLQNGKKPKKKRGCEGCKRRTFRKSSLYDSLYSDYLSIRLRPTYRDLPIQMVCDLLVNRPAPSFYLSEKRADEIIASLKKMKNQKL